MRTNPGSGIDALDPMRDREVRNHPLAASHDLGCQTMFWRLCCIAGLAAFSIGAKASDLTYLQGLLAATPAGGWVLASTTTFSSAWVTDTTAAPASPSGPYAMINAWSGFSWDSLRGNLILSGGGHANYVGNEVYVWSGATGAWTQGSLASRVDLQTGMVVGQDAPQAAHGFQTNTYAVINDRHIVLGAGTWNAGGMVADLNGRTGVWWWNPALADSGKVGGGDGTGWDPSSPGSNSWQKRPYDPWVGLPTTSGKYSYASAYRIEGGKDVIYYTMEQNGSGFPLLMRYELGSATTPDTWQVVGLTAYSVAGQGTAMIDTTRGLFVRVADNTGPYTADLAVWNLANNNTANPDANRELPVVLVTTTGAAWSFAYGAALDYDVANDQYVIWDSNGGGAVWVVKPEYDTNGQMKSVWTVRQLASTTSAQPVGSHMTGVWGKWEYVEELGAFIALDSYNSTTGDAGVWLYKPLATAVPEVPPWQALGIGCLALFGLVKRSQRH